MELRQMDKNKSVTTIVGATGALAAGARAETKRADSDPLKNANHSQRDGWFKKSPDRWKEVPKMEWGGDRTMASELETVIKDADATQWPALEKKLLAVLATGECTDPARGFVCRMLRLIGSPACVPALAPMLADPEQADRARYALELIPGAAVDAALREALGKLTGEARTGLAGTIAAHKQFGT